MAVRSMLNGRKLKQKKNQKDNLKKKQKYGKNNIKKLKLK